MTRSASPARGVTSSSSLSRASLRLNSSSAWMDTANLLVFISGQQRAQLAEAPAGRGLHCALGDAEGSRGLGHRGVEEVAEHEHLALDGGQTAQHADEHVAAVDRLG